MRRLILVLGQAALFVLVLAVPAFAGADVLPTECQIDTDPEYDLTVRLCYGNVSTPSGNYNNHVGGVTEHEGTTYRFEGTEHIRYDQPSTRSSQQRGDKDVGESAGAEVQPTECDTTIYPELYLTDTNCSGYTITPSGNDNSHRRGVEAYSENDEFGGGYTEYDTYIAHYRPAR
jgi:hypothetical protein